MRIKILILLLCFLKLSFGQITHPFSTKQLFYTYNNNLDTIFFTKPTFHGITICDIKLVDTININKSGLKECVFIKTCEGWISEHGGTFDIVENLETKTYEVWDLDKKVQIFSSTFFYYHKFNRITGGRFRQKGINTYEYSVDFKSDKIFVSNLRIEPRIIESDTLFYSQIVNDINVENEVGLYQFDGNKFLKLSPIETIHFIFNEYILNQESTDSKANKDLMSVSLKSLSIVTNKDELDILVNVWMYYDPTDYPDIPEIYRILKDSSPHSIEAVKNRIDNKKEWETDDTAPYSDLKSLLKRLENE